MNENNTPNPNHSSPPDDPETLRRRQFLNRLCLGIAGFAGLGLGVPAVGFVLGPLLRPVPRTWRGVGKLRDFKIGETTNVTLINASPLPWAGVTARSAAWVRRVDQNQFLAFSVNCTHLGCPVRWNPAAKLFLCPCHGGVYYANGDVAGGPPPKPLPRYPIRVRADEVEILASPTPITTV